MLRDCSLLLAAKIRALSAGKEIPALTVADLPREVYPRCILEAGCQP